MISPSIVPEAIHRERKRSDGSADILRALEACGSRGRGGGCAPVGDPDDIRLPAAHEIAPIALNCVRPWT